MSLNSSFLNFTPNCCSREILRERRKEKAIGGVIILSQMRRVNNLRLLIKTFALHRRHSPTVRYTFSLVDLRPSFSPPFSPLLLRGSFIKELYTSRETRGEETREREKERKNDADGLIKIPIRGNAAGRGPILEIMSICSAQSCNLSTPSSF